MLMPARSTAVSRSARVGQYGSPTTRGSMPSTSGAPGRGRGVRVAQQPADALVEVALGAAFGGGRLRVAGRTAISVFDAVACPPNREIGDEIRVGFDSTLEERDCPGRCAGRGPSSSNLGRRGAEVGDVLAPLPQVAAPLRVLGQGARDTGQPRQRTGANGAVTRRVATNTDAPVEHSGDVAGVTQTPLIELARGYGGGDSGQKARWVVSIDGEQGEVRAQRGVGLGAGEARQCGFGRRRRYGRSGPGQGHLRRRRPGHGDSERWRRPGRGRGG